MLKILCLYLYLRFHWKTQGNGAYIRYGTQPILLKNVFNYEDNDIFWCTADIGWITGHSYILYGPLLNGATTVIFEGVPSYPDYSRFWEVIKHKVTQFYTAPPTAKKIGNTLKSLASLAL
jgi:acyl-coenzyme A synthetase/AMP-(fatty) acid ligase